MYYIGNILIKAQECMPATSGSSYCHSSYTSSTPRPPATIISMPYVPGFSSYAAGNPSLQLQIQQICHEAAEAE
ncbi:uncharacterized protein C8R40DRAFT_1101253 [Lentinula edodes]|uniref:uncharacterized protein n=1 Tax=Lentinula edodes TaxID=5353 RepID=UPI001E8CA088|nr:uncharacterized protein C8R40DRAFT_1101253 [Lentinula edodes]KAH7875788.1 hypothetical protein C8R40DRAFT_1101253 [Lentinula edodes]